jgi:hypothetical protein
MNVIVLVYLSLAFTCPLYSIIAMSLQQEGEIRGTGHMPLQNKVIGIFDRNRPYEQISSLCKRCFHTTRVKMPVPTVPPRSILGGILDDEKKWIEFLINKGILCQG